MENHLVCYHTVEGYDVVESLSGHKPVLRPVDVTTAVVFIDIDVYWEAVKRGAPSAGQR